jgi:hypothetical protein
MAALHPATSTLPTRHCVPPPLGSSSSLSWSASIAVSRIPPPPRLALSPLPTPPNAPSNRQVRLLSSPAPACFVSVRFRCDSDLTGGGRAAEPGGARGVDAAVARGGGGAAQPQVVEAAHGHVHAPLPAQRLLLQALRARQGHAPGHQQGHRRRHHQRQGPPAHAPVARRRQRVQDHREAHRREIHGR